MNEEEKIRLALVENKMEKLSKDLESIEKKIDALLELKNKGLGAVWLVTLIFGSSLVAGMASVMNWMRG